MDLKHVAIFKTETLMLYCVMVPYLLYVCISAGAEASGASVQAAAGGRARPRQLPARVHRRARASHAG